MANPRHVARLRASVESWNMWREVPANRTEIPDLQGSNLVGANLRRAQLARAKLAGADLTEADLSGADLTEADLRKANLTGANLSEASIRKANLSESDLSGTDLRRADLSGANLIMSDLVASNLGLADLRSANLSGARARDARLSGANMTSAGLFGCDLSGADLSGCNLSEADLSEADLTGANLLNAHLFRADLAGATFRDAIASGCSFGANDLSRTRGLEQMVHLGPSSIATTTLMRTAEGLRSDLASGGQIERFLRGCGVEDQWLQLFRSLIGRPFEFQSCFITHGPADRGIAQRIHDALQAHGIRCWRDERAFVQNGTDERIGEGMSASARILLGCSASAQSSDWFTGTIDRALDREQRLSKLRRTNVRWLLPIMLDRSLASWNDTRAAALRQRVAADFTGAEQSNAVFEQQIERVLTALRTNAEGQKTAATS